VGVIGGCFGSECCRCAFWGVSIVGVFWDRSVCYGCVLWMSYGCVLEECVVDELWVCFGGVCCVGVCCVGVSVVGVSVLCRSVLCGSECCGCKCSR
jgi:hypothetical protein